MHGAAHLYLVARTASEGVHLHGGLVASAGGASNRASGQRRSNAPPVHCLLAGSPRTSLSGGIMSQWQRSPGGSHSASPTRQPRSPRVSIGGSQQGAHAQSPLGRDNGGRQQERAEEQQQQQEQPRGKAPRWSWPQAGT